jgi:UDP-3-O-[3-hydroxymyristoyl] glucosamine N-acyltransferase
MATSSSPSPPKGHDPLGAPPSTGSNGHRNSALDSDPPDAAAAKAAPVKTATNRGASGVRPARRRASTSTGNASAVKNEPSRSFTVGEIALLLGADLVGDAQTLITGVAGLDSTGPGMISFIESDRLLDAALDSAASAIIAPANIAAQFGLESLGSTAASTSSTVAPSNGSNGNGAPRLAKPILLTRNPRLAFAKVMEYLSPLSLPERGVHPSAIIEPTAHIGEGVTVREFCYIGHHARIEDGAIVYPHVVVGDGAQIGAASILYPSVVIHHHVHIGRRVRVHSGTVIGGDGFGYVTDGDKHVKMPQVGTVIVEDDVEIGSNVCIDRATMGATRIGSGTKIDNLVQIAHNVQVGRNCILCGQVGLSGSVIVEDNVLMAGQAGLADHVKIGRGAVLGAKVGIMADVPAEAFVMGSPAVPQREFMKREAAARKLPEAVRTLRKLEREMQELREQMAELKKQNER